MTKTVNRYEQDLAVELLEAVRTGNRRGVATLLMAGASVNGLPEADARPLLLAAESGDVRKMHVLIENGADVNAGAFRRRDRGGRRKGEGQLVEGTRPMHLAVKTGNKDAVRLLLSAGANPSLADKRGLTPLMSACRVCNGFRVARELLRAGADACSADRNGSTAAHYAAREGHEDLLELVLAKAPVALSQPDRDGRTPLFVAAANGRGGALRRLLALGAKQPAAGGASVGTRCPLQEAVRRNDGEVTRILVDQGMEAIGGGASAMVRAMETAAEAGRAKILQVLLAVQEGERVGYGDAMHCVQRQRARSASSGEIRNAGCVL